MKILKLGLLLLTGIGFGFGTDKLTETGTIQDDQDNFYGGIYFGYCHSIEYFLDHILENISEEEHGLVQIKVDELLEELDVSLEELNYDSELRHEFMNEIMNFLVENDIDYSHYHEQDDWYHGMGMH